MISPAVSALDLEWLGCVDYATMLRRQRTRRKQVLHGENAEVFWLLEHDPVITTGRRGGMDGSESLRGLPVIETERGGLATYHGPGQLVGYLIVDISKRSWRIRDVIAGIEQGVKAWLLERGVNAKTREGAPGLFVGSDKICAVGMHFRRGVSMHGFSLNLTNDLTAYQYFTPCGLKGVGVTSLLALNGESPKPQAAALEVGTRIIHAIKQLHR